MLPPLSCAVGVAPPIYHADHAQNVREGRDNAGPAIAQAKPTYDLRQEETYAVGGRIDPEAW
jgi:hypothetical protein